MNEREAILQLAHICETLASMVEHLKPAEEDKTTARLLRHAAFEVQRAMIAAERENAA